MSGNSTLPDDARREVRRVVMISRAAGGVVVLALLAMAIVVHHDDLSSIVAFSQLATVAVGALAFFSLSTLARLGHTRVIERSLTEVRRLTEELRLIAETDPLTGLSNLRAFQGRLEQEVSAAEAAGTNVSLIVADLDNFKLLNDAYGHQFGDGVLKAAASAFAEAAGTTACAARLGGDEFAIILPGAGKGDAETVSANINARLGSLDLGKAAPPALGSFGVATFPEDGGSVQALFACADSRMYGEKHRRKSATAVSAAGAARNLFVRVGQSMRPERSTVEILREVATSARDEFSLSLCGIAIAGREPHPALSVAVGTRPEYEEAFLTAAPNEMAPASSIASGLPGEMWVLDAPVPDDAGTQGVIVLAGMPSASFRPDALITLALADLVHAVVANGRAHVEAQRAGMERDIHIDLARALAASGALPERLVNVTDMIAAFSGLRSISIEALSLGEKASPLNVASGLRGRALERWQAARSSDEAQRFVLHIAANGPVVLEDPAEDERIPADERELLKAAGVQSAMVCPIRFDGQLLGILGAVSEDAARFDDVTVEMLMSIAEHLAPAVKVALLRDELEASYRQLEQASRQSLVRLADAAEARDPHTGGHLRRIQTYSVALAREVGLSEREATAIGVASTIHDLGKLRLPDAILQKRGKLDLDDWARMREHPEDGERLIGDSPMFAIERIVARWHHERWDGTGYPDGLKGDDIPLPARIVAVADAFDALTTARPYKPAWPIADAVAEIRRMKGKLFCPAVVGALERLWHSGRLETLFEAAAGRTDGAGGLDRAA